MTQNSAIRIEQQECDFVNETSPTIHHSRSLGKKTFNLSNSQIKFGHPFTLNKVTQLHRTNLVKGFS